MLIDIHKTKQSGSFLKKGMGRGPVRGFSGVMGLVTHRVVVWVVDNSGDKGLQLWGGDDYVYRLLNEKKKHRRGVFGYSDWDYSLIGMQQTPMGSNVCNKTDVWWMFDPCGVVRSSPFIQPLTMSSLRDENNKADK